MNILYFDCETTGLDPEKNDIIQMAGIIEIDGEVKEEFEFKCRPSEGGQIDLKALRINGFIDKPTYSFPNPDFVLEKFFHNLDEHKPFILAGKNIDFDKKFIYKMSEIHGYDAYRSYFKHQTYDLTTLAIMCAKLRIFEFKEFSLAYLAKFFDFKYMAHDAAQDIKVTYKIFKKIEEAFKKEIGGNILDELAAKGEKFEAVIEHYKELKVENEELKKQKDSIVVDTAQTVIDRLVKDNQVNKYIIKAGFIQEEAKKWKDKYLEAKKTIDIQNRYGTRAVALNKENKVLKKKIEELKKVIEISKGFADTASETLEENSRLFKKHKNQAEHIEKLYEVNKRLEKRGDDQYDLINKMKNKIEELKSQRDSLLEI